MGINIDHDELMEGEIKECLSDLYNNQEEIGETSFHRTQENIQQTVELPLAENETCHDLDVNTHVPSP